MAIHISDRQSSRNGSWRVKNADLQPFKREFGNLWQSFAKLTLRYVPRAKNLAGLHIEDKLKHG